MSALRSFNLPATLPIVGAMAGPASVTALSLLSAWRRVPGNPVARDIDSAADPDLVMLLHVVEEALQRTEATGPADQAAMQAN